MKKGFIRAGILMLVFILAVIFFSILTGRKNADMTVDMGRATLPRVYFEIEGYQANALVGYTEKMDLTAMRDTLTPLDANGNVSIRVQKFDEQVNSFAYKIYTLDGKTCLQKGEKQKLNGEQIQLSLGEVLNGTKEAVLQLELYPEQQEVVYYYTRVAPAYEYHIKECMDFAAQFHTDAITKAVGNSISSLLETDSASDKNTLQHVTIHSNYTQVLWGDMTPEVEGEIDYSIKESNEMYTSLQLTYQAAWVDEQGEKEIYHVKEYFKIRDYKDQLYLLDYDRTMNQIFDHTRTVIADNGIDLGVAPEELSYVVNENGRIVSFVQERELWNYNPDEDELSLVFSFKSEENKDIRNSYDQHKIKIISMDENGSTTFAVYGYMNRGNHEGKVGAAIYYYNIEANSVEEKAFIPSRQSFAIAENELGRFIYYNHEKNTLYVMIEGALYQIRLAEDKQEVLVAGLTEGQYVASEDGCMIAYQTNGSLDEATEIRVMNLKNGKNYTVTAGEGETVHPLGFIYEDFICGTARKEDAGRTVSGETILPMYKLDIRRNGKETEKTYQAEGMYVTDVFVEDNMITVNRVTRSDSIYTGAAADYITNNQETEPSNVMLESYNSTLKLKEMRLTFEDGIEDESPKLLQPKQVLFENPVTISLDAGMSEGKYYVYGLGEMLGVYDKAGYAVQKADEVSGVVVNARQQCIWETGNRDLQYMTEGLSGGIVEENESTLAASIRILAEREGTPVHATEELLKKSSAAAVLGQVTGGEGLDLSGCTVEQIFYIIGKGTPVIAVLGEGNAVLMTGYDRTTVTCLNPADGSVTAVPIETMEQRTAGSGHTFIGYVK